MRVRNFEFDDDTKKLFIERFIDYVGNPYNTLRIMEGVTGGCGIFEAEEDKELRREYHRLDKLNDKLIEENDDYVERIMRYEKTLSKLRLEEWIE